ncbi:putative gustatory receptor candidate 59 [Operophtera brumata]|uniref:Putative gustatory receptor candidate 59 n=1 Tax=Operophtera brumata TaxID=104452 RepID=A0A0L7LDF2_OPEBR|nr:putative gustatory receptor candidate 59 [Operophtera brumata]
MIEFLPAVPGYVPVYIQSGDTPLDQINPELAEAFHALPAGRSASQLIEALPEELADQPREDTPVSSEDIVDHRPYAKKILEKKKKVASEVEKPIERR